eukprot:SAG22_NODE_5134_length_1079_cov_3.641837_2_plen_275_part_01
MCFSAFPCGSTALTDDRCHQGSGSPWVEFQEYGGGIWNGIYDQSSAFALVWEESALYLGIKVFDDTHQNPGSGWNGDTVQVAFAAASRAGGVILYNYGLADSGDHVLHHERHPCPADVQCTEAAIQRVTKTTIYEIKFPAHALGIDVLATGYGFGLGVCVNDGDTDAAGQAGQRGWSGWGPYSIVFGKNAASTGLVTLTGDSVCSNLADWTPTAEADVVVGIEAADLVHSAQARSVDIDADLSDWGCAPFLAQTPFRTGNEGTEAPWVEFEEYGG